MVKTKNVITSTENSCSCGFSSSMGLPCRQIMAYRKIRSLPVFQQDLCRLRWTRSYFLASHPVFSNTKKQRVVQIVPTAKTECEKYKEAHKVTREINSLLSTMPNDKYDYYMEKLRAFSQLLSLEKPIFVTECCESRNNEAEEEQSVSTESVPDLQQP